VYAPSAATAAALKSIAARNGISQETGNKPNSLPKMIDLILKDD
jgi:hypothetical protein